MFTKIKDSDLERKGVVGQPQVPGLSVADMQYSVEQVVREVAIPAVNRLIDELAEPAAAGKIGAVLTEEAGREDGSVQEALDLTTQSVRLHAGNMNNPHGVTAAQTGAYTKEETEQRLDEKMAAIGAGDMVKAVYGGSEDGVVAKADEAGNAGTVGGFLPHQWQNNHTAIGPDSTNFLSADWDASLSRVCIRENSKEGAQFDDVAVKSAKEIVNSTNRPGNVYSFEDDVGTIYPKVNGDMAGMYLRNLTVAGNAEFAAGLTVRSTDMKVGSATISSQGDQNFLIRPGTETGMQVHLGVVDGGWAICTEGDAVYELGRPGKRFHQIYLVNQPAVTSDEQQKNSIEDVDETKAAAFFAALRPRTFKLNNGESGRTHWGFIAQQVEQAMTAAGLTDMDFAGFIRSPKYEETVNEGGTTGSREVPGEYVYSLRYGEFIALLTAAVQSQQRQLERMKERLDSLGQAE